jgi:hypothetical protein
MGWHSAACYANSPIFYRYIAKILRTRKDKTVKVLLREWIENLHTLCEVLELGLILTVKNEGLSSSNARIL